MGKLMRVDGRVAPRSGLASKHFIDTGAGVIDADYRGEVKVLLFNFSEVDFAVKQGERVAQLVLERVSLFPFPWMMYDEAGADEGRFIPLRLRSLRNWRRAFVVRAVSEALVLNLSGFVNRMGTDRNVDDLRL